MQSMRCFIGGHGRVFIPRPGRPAAGDCARLQARHRALRPDENGVPPRGHACFEAGRDFCFNMAPDAGAIRRVRDQPGLPFAPVCQVAAATPGDLFFKRRGSWGRRLR